MRYLNQTNRHSCGPVAVINALKWAGIKATWEKDGKRITKLCNTTKDGTLGGDVTVAVRKASKGKIKVTRRFIRLDLRTFRHSPRSDLQKIDRHLKKGGAVLLDLSAYNLQGEICGHISCCVGKDGDFYLIANHVHRTDMVGGNTVQRIHKNFLFDELQACYGHSYWLLTKNGH